MEPRTTALTADFARQVDHPLSKAAFAVFNSGLVGPQTYARDRELIARAHPESCRIDLGWGAEWMGQPPVASGSGWPGPVYDFSWTDAVARTLDEAGVRPYLSYCYVPQPYRPDGGDWRDLAELTGWAALVRSYVADARSRGIRIGYHEVYNEPDLRDERTNEAVFFTGDLEDYLNMYRVTAPAIREADPATPVGGPALALVHPDEHWIPAFLDTVLIEELPLDFFSFHHYGTYTLATAIDKVLAHVDARPGLGEVDVHLNEYNSFPVDYPRGGPQDGPLLAAAMLADFARLLARPGVTKTSWAQFMDSGHDNYSGMIDIDGVAKPVYRAYLAYQDMPVDRFELAGSPDRGTGGFAAAEPGRACVMVWNRSSVDVKTDLAITGLSGHPIAGRLTRIDADHNGSVDEDVTPDLASAQITVTLPRGGTAILHITTDEPTSPPTPAGVTRRVRRRQPHKKSGAWADFDEATTTFRLGGADAPATLPAIGAHIRIVQPQLTVTAEQRRADGSPTTRGTLLVRVDTDASSTDLVFGTLTGRQAPSAPSWLANDLPHHRHNFDASGVAEIDLRGVLGDLSTEVTISVIWLTDEPATFAKVAIAATPPSPHR